MIFGTNALFTKPAQSLAPMMVVHILSWYGYKVRCIFLFGRFFNKSQILTLWHQGSWWHGWSKHWNTVKKISLEKPVSWQVTNRPLSKNFHWWNYGELSVHSINLFLNEFLLQSLEWQSAQAVNSHLTVSWLSANMSFQVVLHHNYSFKWLILECLVLRISLDYNAWQLLLGCYFCTFVFGHFGTVK